MSRSVDCDCVRDAVDCRDPMERALLQLLNIFILTNNGLRQGNMCGAVGFGRG